MAFLPALQTGGTLGYDVSATFGHSVNSSSNTAPPWDNAMAPRLFTGKTKGLSQASPWPSLAQSSKTLGRILGLKKQARGTSVSGWRPSQRHFLSGSLLQATGGWI